MMDLGLQVVCPGGRIGDATSARMSIMTKTTAPFAIRNTYMKMTVTHDDGMTYELVHDGPSKNH